MRLGIVIPALDEASTLPHLLDDLEALSLPHVVRVADGGSSDGTCQVALDRGIPVTVAPPGRGRQMNAGAATLDTPWLLFLHADSRMPPDAVDALEAWLANAPPENASAHFRLRLGDSRPWWRWVERGQRLRQSLTGIVYGDQGLLVHRSTFEAVAGFPDVPVFEDIEMVRSLRRVGPVSELDAALTTSTRRYEQDGRLKALARNTALTTLYLIGVPPARLGRWYGPRRPTHANGRPTDHSGRTLLVFAKAPVPGQVKTRVARELGDAEAAELYSRMGRLVVDRVRSGPYRTVVCFDPPDQETLVREWLGSNALDFRAQAAGGLGERLDDAFRTAFRAADKVCVIGTDAPDVGEDLVEVAFDALDSHDVVMGPAEDGGYYLLGLSSPAPELFDGVPWSTADVARVTLERARRAGRRVATLPVLRDVDHAHQIPEIFR